VALAAGSFAAAGIVTLLAAFFRVAAWGHDALTVGAAARLPLAAGFGLVAAAVILTASRAYALRPATVALAAVLPAAAVVSGAPVAALLAATTATGLAIAHDRRRPGRAVPLIPAAPALAATALFCLTAGLALAETADVHRESPRSQAAPGGPRSAAPATTPAPRKAAPSRTATATSHAAPSPAPTTPPSATPHASPSPAATGPPSSATPHATPSPAPTAVPVATPPSSATPHATPSPAATPAPAASSPAPAAAGSPGALVAAYYAALDARRFRAAWAVLAAGVRRSFGGFAHWRNGYASTVSSTPVRIAVSAQPGGVFAVRHVLVARDRAGCGTKVRRYAVSWRIGARLTGGWSVTSLTAVALRQGGSCS
jgi:hypothetical protein